MSAQDQMRAMLDQLMGTARDGKRTNIMSISHDQIPKMIILEIRMCCVRGTDYNDTTRCVPRL